MVMVMVGLIGKSSPICLITNTMKLTDGCFKFAAEPSTALLFKVMTKRSSM